MRTCFLKPLILNKESDDIPFKNKLLTTETIIGLLKNNVQFKQPCCSGTFCSTLFPLSKTTEKGKP